MTHYKKNALRSIVLASTLALGVYQNAQAQISDNVVKIGVLTDMSGPYSDFSGKGSITATQMAISDFEKKYHPNYKIEMISADHQDKADITSNKAREWFDREHVDMITDLVSSIAGLSAMKVAKEKDKIVIITGAGSSKITNAGCNDVTVHYVYDTYATGQGTAKAVVKQGGKTWFFFNS